MNVVRAALVVLVSVAVAAGVAFVVGAHGVALAGVPVLVWIALACFAVNWLAFVPAAVMRTEHFYDLTGSLTYLTVVALALIATAAHGLVLDAARVVPAVLVVVWAVRLGTFLFGRVRRVGKDGRFDEMKQSPPRFLVAWTLQGLWVFLTSVAAVVLITTGRAQSVTPVHVVGWLMWAAGFLIEVAADRQKAAFSANVENRGRFIDVGLWAWSRHPNYFGEIVLWLGVFVSGASTYAGGEWLAVLSPVFVALLLMKVSGVPLLEERADRRWGADERYQAYKARTPVLVPRLPRS
jgi:steroid 5-alpha reductase family enzyme